MKKRFFASVLLIASYNCHAQNVGINAFGTSPATSAALDVDILNKGILIPRVALTSANAFAPVTGAQVASLMVYNTAVSSYGINAVTPGYYYWDGFKWVRLLSNGNSWTVGSTAATVNYPGTTAYFGTSDNNHIDLVTSGLIRGRMSNLGEFFIGTTNTALPGDLMNGVGNVSFPFAINGYTAQNGIAVFGMRQANAVGTWAAVQGETDITLLANNSGVTGIAGATTHRGVTGQKPAGGTGWGGLFLNDLGYSGSFLSVSDERLKINIKPLSGALDKVMDMKFYTYNHDTITYSSLGSGNLHYGVMAQELKAVIPSLVATKNIAPSTERSTTELVGPEFDVNLVNYVELIPIALQAMQEQQAQIAQQQLLIEALTKKIAALEQR